MAIALYIDGSASGTKTLGELRARIADEIDRSDLSSQIALAIDDAIIEASADRFHFNEARGLPFESAAGIDAYSSDDISALTQIDGLYYFDDSGQRRNLCAANALEIDRWSEGDAASGEPTRYALQGQMLRLWPVPQQSWTFQIDGVTRLPPLTADSQHNGWTNDGERLIRAIAKRILLIDVLRDYSAAQAQELLVQRYRGELLARSYDRAASGRIAAHG